ncbi:TIGR01777 family oxidoreductase [Flavihumibacter petaseus]|uniref:TIGR01777 family protein n=1 Tax=Flavihumibacter petaseus NBRC 106054 TaxID=1220578 RepID=A0A0E9N040_9BACT|nr:TIGR01777 family oxidoreductase [Flavihumibacter petaseus]GAO42986.1 hypothetical protein FPE01S_02_00910 [Flavihumibacter petaseus NBRC 106054]
MYYNKIVIAGGNGYIGQLCCRYFREKTSRLIVLTRSDKTPATSVGNIETVQWDGRSATGRWTAALEGADLLINLCGKNVNCRYTSENCAVILSSRIQSTAALGEAIRALECPPAVWINASSATIYRHAEDGPQDEHSGAVGYGFSVDVVRAWEKTFFDSNTPRTRKIALRMGIVLGRADGAFRKWLQLVRYGLGGRQGTGQQMISWIHEWDVMRAVEWLLHQPEASGIYNFTAPEAVSNCQFMKLLSESYGTLFSLPCPQWLLEAAACLADTEAELILKSRWVRPARLLEEGFQFHYGTAKAAIDDLLAVRPLAAAYA